ncbi:MAG: SDR family oxidoreductase [Acidisphaera sp.]|nr:SDR family oxidoreductase [Acidisphaera sp.]
MAEHWLDLHGRVCVVTGAAGGIGRAVCAAFAQAGAAAIVMLDREQAACEAVAASLDAPATKLVPLACDVSDEASVSAAAERARSAGSCDILVNNAGLLRPGPLATLSVAEWNALLGVNLTGCLICAQVFGRQMLERNRGAIVHTASIAASHPQGFSGAYSVSKVGVVMLSRQIALEWGPSGIRSNVVSPGLVRTPMSEAFYQAPGVEERRSAMVPSRRIATPEDMANAILFLASDRASYINGEEIIVDGGFNRILMSTVPRPGFDGSNQT